jgi:hypothetical protein
MPTIPIPVNLKTTAMHSGCCALAYGVATYSDDS